MILNSTMKAWHETLNSLFHLVGYLSAVVDRQTLEACVWRCFCLGAEFCPVRLWHLCLIFSRENYGCLLGLPISPYFLQRKPNEAH